ncbi:MAG TPA: transcriptional regulator GcvA [Burkholderiaceae bacterium]|nr:transcriptional regulator GcvA [Burkholderiaceae bacterium]
MATDRKEIPPLELLRAFEAAARRLSFTLAADELFLTQSAVSRQIKALEEHLGVPLFERRHRALVLNEAGQSLYRTTADVLERLRQTTRELRRDRRSRAFTVTTTISFASLWLVPRLSQFVRDHPGIDVRIAATSRVMDVRRESIEFAVRYLPREKAEGIPIFGEQMLPLCSPALARDRSRPLREPQDLAAHTLLHPSLDDIGPGYAGYAELGWPQWLESMGLRDLKPAGALRFSQYDQLVQAAIDGQGVALGRLPLLADLVRARKLVRPFASSVDSPRAYYLIEGPGVARNPDAVAFRDWLLAAARAAAR